MSDASLRRAYTALAPLYDPLFARVTAGGRRRALELLGVRPGESVLLLGGGTGLDLPHLPREARYTGVDLTGSMLRRAAGRAGRRTRSRTAGRPGSCSICPRRSARLRPCASPAERRPSSEGSGRS